MQAGQELITVANLQQVWLQFEALESETRWLELDRQVIVRDDWGDERSWEGRVVFIDPVVDSKTRTQRVRIEVENARRPDGTFVLSPGRQVSATLRVPIDERGLPADESGGLTLAIPRGALLRSGERDVVYVCYRDVVDADGQLSRDYEIDPAASLDDVSFEMVEVVVGELAQREDTERLDRYHPLIRVVPPPPSSKGTGLGAEHPRARSPDRLGGSHAARLPGPAGRPPLADLPVRGIERFGPRGAWRSLT